MMMADQSYLWAAGRERARCWLQAGSDLRGYPTLPAEEEIEDRLAAAPTEKAEKNPKPAAGRSVN
jgi:hypothetical protein